MKDPTDRVTRRSVVGGIVGATAGWALSAAFPSLMLPLSAAGGHIGGRVAEKIVKIPFLYKQRIKSAFFHQVKIDLENSCLTNAALHHNSINSFTKQFQSKGVLPTDFTFLLGASDIDQRAGSNLKESLDVIKSSADKFVISCPSIFPAALSACYKLSEIMRGYDIELVIDFNDPNSRSQLMSLSGRFYCDFAIIADPPFLMGSNRAKYGKQYYPVSPIFSHDDCMIASSFYPDTSGGTPEQIVYHESSTGEFLLRKSALGTSRKFLKPTDQPQNVSIIRSSLLGGGFVTTWEPMTSILKYHFPDVVEVPQTRIRTSVSLYAAKNWKVQREKNFLMAFSSAYNYAWKSIDESYIKKILDEYPEIVYSYAKNTGLEEISSLKSN